MAAIEPVYSGVENDDCHDQLGKPMEVGVVSGYEGGDGVRAVLGGGRQL